MTDIIAWLTGRIAGPVMAGLAVVLALALAGLWLTYSSRISDREKTISELRLSIEAPGTGWAARLGQCQGNVATLSAGFDRMAADIKRLGEETAASTAAAAKAAQAAAAESRNARQRADRVLALPRPEPQQACTAATAILRGMTP